MRIYELTKGQAFQKHGGRQKGYNLGRRGVRDFKSKHKATDAPTSRNDDKITFATNTQAGSNLSVNKEDLPQTVQNLGLQSRYGPYRALDIWDVEAIDEQNPQGRYKFTRQQKHADDKYNHNEGKILAHLRMKKEAKFLYEQTGIYVFMHDDHGIFYIGIAARAAADSPGHGFESRHLSHLKKIMGRLDKGVPYAPNNWIEFAKDIEGKRQGIEFDDTGEMKEDLRKIKIAFYVVAQPEGMTYEEYKEHLEAIETRQVQRMNPRMNDASARNLPSVTKGLNHIGTDRKSVKYYTNVGARNQGNEDPNKSAPSVDKKFRKPEIEPGWARNLDKELGEL